MTAALPFAGAAPYYRFRPPYPDAAFDFVCAELGLDLAARVLDLGCGNGRIALALAPRVREVVAVDIDPDMLAEAERAAHAAGRANVRFLCARAEELPRELGRFRAATLGQSFHWMDRDRVLRVLAPMLEPRGGIALFAPGRRRPRESWEECARAVAERYLGPHRRHPLTNPERENEPALLRSPDFAPPLAREFPSEIERDFASVLGCLYSHSTTAKPLFGARAPEFERELAAALAALHPAGVFRERLETEVVLAHKSAGRA